MSYEQASLQLSSFCKETKKGFLFQDKSGKIFYHRVLRPNIKKRLLFLEKEFVKFHNTEFICKGKPNKDWKNTIIDLSQDVCILSDGYLYKLVTDPILENHNQFRLLMNIIDQKRGKIPPLYTYEKIKEILETKMRNGKINILNNNL